MDPDKLAALSLRVWSYKQGEVVALMVHLGDQLGLYKAMADQGPIGAERVATLTGLDARWLLEWLRCQGAAGLLETVDGELFELTEEGAEVLAKDAESTWFAAGAFQGLVATPDTIGRLMDAFRTGQGLSYDDLGPNAAHGVERLTAPWTKLVLVPVVVPGLRGMEERLERGARVADVGCGAGVALVAMAAAYPESKFEGYDPSTHAVGLAREKVREAGLSNVEVHCLSAADLPAEETYDFILTLDCLHDMPRPAEAMRAIRRSIKPDGTWLIKDIRSAPTWQGNLRNPMLALMYGTSVATCMSSALSEPDGAGLGTLGLHPELAEQMCRDAGFSEFVVHDFHEPANLYYEVRP